MLELASEGLTMESAPLLFCTVEGCKSPRASQDPRASNRQCTAHQAEQNRKYNASRLTQQRGRGYVEGVEDMRDLLVKEFIELGEGMMTCNEAAYYIRRAIGPLAKADEPEAEKKDDRKGKPLSGIEKPHYTRETET